MAKFAMAVAIGSAVPARADRHCAPALEQYYGARHSILSPGLDGRTADAFCQRIVAEACH